MSGHTGKYYLGTGPMDDNAAWQRLLESLYLDLPGTMKFGVCTMTKEVFISYDPISADEIRAAKHILMDVPATLAACSAATPMSFNSWFEDNSGEKPNETRE